MLPDTNLPQNNSETGDGRFAFSRTDAFRAFLRDVDGLNGKRREHRLQELARQFDRPESSIAAGRNDNQGTIAKPH